MTNIEQNKQSAEFQAELLSKRLEAFVRYWAPRGSDLYEFQRDLMDILCFAMRSQNATLSSGIDNYASQLYQQASIRPLGIIMKTDPNAPSKA